MYRSAHGVFCRRNSTSNVCTLPRRCMPYGRSRSGNTSGSALLRHRRNPPRERFGRFHSTSNVCNLFQTHTPDRNLLRRNSDKHCSDTHRSLSARFCKRDNTRRVRKRFLRIPCEFCFCTVRNTNKPHRYRLNRA